MKTILLPIMLEWFALNFSPALDASEQLGSNRFKVRQDTARALEKTWPWSKATIKKAAQSKDNDISDRAKTILARCRCNDLEACGQPPWADWPLWSFENRGWVPDKCLLLNRAIRIHIKPNYDSGDGLQWNNYRDVSRQWAMDAMDAGLPASAVKIWFSVGRAVDADYKRAPTINPWKPETLPQPLPIN